MTEKEYPAPDDQWPQKGGTGSGNTTGYSVQARMALYEPKQIGPYLLDTRWKTIHFPDTTPGNGIRQSAAFHWDPKLYGLHTWDAAQALRYWFISEAALTHDDLCLETRIVEHKITYSFSTESVGATEPIGWRTEDRYPSRKKNVLPEIVTNE